MTRFNNYYFVILLLDLVFKTDFRSWTTFWNFILLEFLQHTLLQISFKISLFFRILCWIRLVASSTQLFQFNFCYLPFKWWKRFQQKFSCWFAKILVLSGDLIKKTLLVWNIRSWWDFSWLFPVFFIILHHPFFLGYFLKWTYR